MIYFLNCLLVIFMLLVCSCANNDKLTLSPEEPENPEEIEMPHIDGKVYGADDDFVLKYAYMSSAGSFDKPFTLEPGQHMSISLTDENKGIFKFTTDNLDLNDIFGDQISGEIPRPTFWGINKEISIPVDIKAYTTASGKGYYLADGVTVIDNIRLSLHNVRIYDSSLTGDMSWSPTNYFECSGINLGSPKDPVLFYFIIPQRNENLLFNSNQIVKDWNSSAYPTNLSEKIAPTDFLQILLSTPFLKAEQYGFDEETASYASIIQLFNEIMTSIMLPDPVSIIPIFASIGKFHSFTFAISNIENGNTTEGSFKLFVDPYKVLYDIIKNSDDMSSYSLVALNTFYTNLLKSVSPANVDGIPMNYRFTSDQNLFFYDNEIADTNLSISILKAIILPLLKDNDNKARLIESLKNDSGLSGQIDLILPLIEDIDNLLDSTTTATIGFSFIRGYWEALEYNKPYSFTRE